ncbi:MAG: hypothetical protein JNJ57_12340 [Saprospiraceae bacterium]|nr:hypothetical protein [Saprospiraceae bacterium]
MKQTEERCFSMARNNYLIFLASCLLIGLYGFIWHAQPANTPKARLSEYGFFTGTLADLSPASRVFEYEVNAPLFTDYAEKKRLIYLPEGSVMKFDNEKAFDFPTGAVLIKNFYYSNDVTDTSAGRKILETRLLIREREGWNALTYVWNEEQSDALLEVAGATLSATWTDKKGKKTTFDYVVPNTNQCKGCHSYDGQFVPIGTTARQLHRTEKGQNQLLFWQKEGILETPSDFQLQTIQPLFDYRLIDRPEDANHQNLDSAARAYLEGNCAHCHNTHGPASTSGMFLEAGQRNMEHVGVGKPPVAAGRGSGNRKYGIVPGKPGESILYFRMESSDPGIRMPELGRQLPHKEGMALIKQWIKAMR